MRKPNLRCKGGALGRGKGKVELGRCTRNGESRLCRSAIRIEGRFRTTNQRARVPDLGDQSMGLFGTSSVHDSVRRSGILPGHNLVVGYAPESREAVGLPSYSE